VTEAIFALVIGLIIGSFLNVIIHRWPRGRSVVKPRSHCVRCRKPIAWYDNIPLVSYLLLRGRCRSCQRPISVRYPAVELITGLFFYYFVRTLGVTGAAVKMCVFASLLIALIFCDLEKRLLPDQLTKGGIVIGFGFALFVEVPGFFASPLLAALFHIHLHGRAQWLAESVTGALLPALSLWLAGWFYEKVRHREGLGFGDVKLIAMVGSFLGLSIALATLIVGSVAGSIIGYTYIKATGKDPATYPLPFGTFLGAAGLLTAMATKYLVGFQL
jgi:leader peptidase (prepilin peptidase) / N-methyltransferase